jgi:2-methylcitrate dehydratase PrpD
VNITQEIAGHVVRTGFDSIPKESVARAKWRVLDAIGCLIAGANAAGCRETADLVRRWGGVPESTVLVHGIKAPAHNAAIVNSLMTRSFDFEPIEAEGERASSPAHISGTTVPAAVTMAEREGASGKDLLAALIIGDDLAARVGVASGFEFDLGWDNTGTMNGMGATAIACKLMKLSEGQISNAFGIALNQLAGSLDGVWDKVMTFKLHMALAGKTGIFSAEMAAQGFTGQKDAFLGRHGYFNLYCKKNTDTSTLTKDLGSRFYADCIIKPHSACRATHGCIDSALKVSAQKDIEPEKVDEVVVNASPGIIGGFCGQPFVLGETPQIDSAFSVRFTVATALLRKEVKPACFTEERIRDPKIQALIDKMKLVAVVPPADAPSRTEVRVKMTDGTTLTGTTDFPMGHVYRTPLTDEEIRTKFKENVAYSRTITRRKAEEALAMLEDLENVGDVRKVVSLLV